MVLEEAKERWCGNQSTSLEAMTCVEYFAGIGLVRVGLEKAGWKVVFSNDWSCEKFEMYSSSFKDKFNHYSVKDIFSLHHSEVPQALLATASFPCIDLSLAGNLEGINGQHSSAFWGFTRLIDSQANKPPLIMLENVPGWLTSNQGRDFRLTVKALNELGYSCDAYAINASFFVPQSRLRIFVVGTQMHGVQTSIEIFKKRSLTLKTKALEKAVSENLDLNWNFRGIPPLPQQTIVDLNQVVENLSPDDKRWWSEYEVKRHLSMMSPVNLAYVKKLRDSRSVSYCSMYRRVREGKQRAELRKDGLAGCLRTARGGSSRQMLVRAGKGDIYMRVMTPREYARLQGVPDSYPVPSQVNQALTGFGDAVCVPVITWIALNILNPLVMSIQEKSLTLHS